MKLIIGDCNHSTRSMRPWLYVHKRRLPVVMECYGLDSSEFHRARSGCFSNGKVPPLVDDDSEVWDSLAILEFLGEYFPDSRPWPEDQKARSVCAEMHSSFGSLRNEAPMNLRRRFPG